MTRTKKQISEIWHGDSIELCQKFKRPPTVREGMIDCVITDPPFGSDNLSNMAVTPEGKTYARKIANDNSPEQAIKTFKAVMASLLPATRNDSDLYIFTAHQVIKEWLVMCDAYLAQFGYKRKAVLVWEKDGPGLGDLTSWGMGCEFILFYKKGHRESTDTRRNNVLHVPQLRPGDLCHPHEKPLPLLQLLIRHSTNKGDFIVDPFGGSGSLVRAAKDCERSAVAIEYDEHNYRLAKQKLDSQGTGLF